MSERAFWYSYDDDEKRRLVVGSWRNNQESLPGLAPEPFFNNMKKELS
jgi:hypothetical protein